MSAFSGCMKRIPHSDKLPKQHNRKKTNYMLVLKLIYNRCVNAKS